MKPKKGNTDKGIRPMSLTTELKDLRSVTEGHRRVGWLLAWDISGRCVSGENFNKVNSEIEEAKNNGFKFLQIYPSPDSDGAKARMEGLEKGGWSKHVDLEKAIAMEYMVHHPDFPKQAEAARRELIRRNGYWNQTDPIADIYMARLMGYGEKHIKRFVKNVYPEFDVEKYMRENTRKELLERINS